jgi:hypothetical protein
VCDNPFCAESHGPLDYDRDALSRLGAYITYTDFIHFICAVFDARFLWQLELYVEALYVAYSKKRTVVVRHVSEFILRGSLLLLLKLTVASLSCVLYLMYR